MNHSKCKEETLVNVFKVVLDRVNTHTHTHTHSRLCFLLCIQDIKSSDCTVYSFTVNNLLFISIIVIVVHFTVDVIIIVIIIIIIYIYFYEWETRVDVLPCTILCKYFFFFSNKARSVFISWNVTWVCVFLLCMQCCLFSLPETVHTSSEEMKTKNLTENYFDTSVNAFFSAPRTHTHTNTHTHRQWREAIHVNLDLWRCLHISSVEAVAYTDAHFFFL